MSNKFRVPMNKLHYWPWLFGQLGCISTRPAGRVGERVLIAVSLFLAPSLIADVLERPGTVFPVFQFPGNAPPRIDGDASDCALAPEPHVVGTDQLQDTMGRHATPLASSLDVRVTVGWLKGGNRLYFLYGAYDDYWNSAEPGLRNDIFELVVDGDLSGGPLIAKFRPNAEARTESEALFTMQGVLGQNYHIFTPQLEKSWAMFWGPQQWLKQSPFANAAQTHSFRPGEGRKYLLEFFTTPFDLASPTGSAHSTPTVLRENTLIGPGWAIIDYDAYKQRNNGFWNLSQAHTVFGETEELLAFRLMPLETLFFPEEKAAWRLQIVNREHRIVAFENESIGEIKSWSQDFADGNESDEWHPIRTYPKAGRYVVVQTVNGPQGI